MLSSLQSFTRAELTNVDTFTNERVALYRDGAIFVWTRTIGIFKSATSMYL
jgi:hypothetical protein